MLTRTHQTPATISRRSHAQRRLRRTASSRLFCSTNGCTTFLVPDEERQLAICPVCGFERRLRRELRDHETALPH